MENKNRSALVATLACGALLVAGGGAAWAATQGTHGQAAPAKATSTEDGNAGQETYRTRSAVVVAGGYASVIVKCPKGKHASGGGYRLSTDNTSVVIGKNAGADGLDADYVPDDGWEVAAHNYGATDAGITASVICRL